MLASRALSAAAMVSMGVRMFSAVLRFIDSSR